MALDNASNNDSLLRRLPEHVPTDASVGTEFQIRCYGHIINLCVRAFLSLFDFSKKAKKANTAGTLMDVCGDEPEKSDSGEEEEEPEDNKVLENEGEERENGDWDVIQ
jgi:hypothetical protein